MPLVGSQTPFPSPLPDERSGAGRSHVGQRALRLFVAHRPRGHPPAAPLPVDGVGGRVGVGSRRGREGASA